MTPEQRQDDLNLIKSARRIAMQIQPRSRKMALVINQLCDRLAALSTAQPLTNAMTQPASTPEQSR